MIRQAILIDQNSISFIEGVVRRGRVDLRAFVRLPKGKFGDSATGDPEFGSPEEPGALLREELERLGWKPSSAMVILSSPSIIDRPLTLPRTPHAALPGVVKLQVEAMSMLKFQNPVCDFSVHRSDRQTMDLAVAITSESTVNQVVTRLGQSGFGVQSVVSVAHTMLTAIQHIPGKDQFNLFLLASDRRIDLMAVQDGKVVASHAELIFGLSTPVSDLLYPVVARFIKAVQRKDERFNPTQALLICDEPSWSENVRDRLEQEHEVASQVFDYRMLFHVDSQAVPNQRSEQLCAESLLLAGALMSQHQPRAERMDLSNPKQPKSRRVLKAFYAATAASLLGWLATTGYLHLEQRRLEVENRWVELRSQVDELTTENQKSERLLRVAEVIGDWEDAKVDWLLELSELKRNLPDKNEAYLRQLVLQSTQDGEFPAATAVGFAKKQSDIMAMNQRISSANSPYEMDPRPFFQNERTEPFVHQFELDLKVTKIASEQLSNKENREVDEQVTSTDADVPALEESPAETPATTVEDPNSSADQIPTETET